MTEDTVHPEDVSPLGRVGNDPIRRAAEHAHREKLSKLSPSITALLSAREAVRDILGITSRRHHSEAEGAGAANADLIREIEDRAIRIRDLLYRSL